ncbi:MAG: TonB-dependent receptor plug domain-containing protein [Candidatus Cryptobacteroides sp.]|nr:TonB-dependent receptor plug domain-containing protein [Candidatus Cryptobacteroides sp.]
MEQEYLEPMLRERLQFKGFMSLFLALTPTLASGQSADTTAATQQIDSSVVTAKTAKMVSRGNIYSFNVEKAASVISVTGEPDILRQMATLPGVSAGMEGSLGLYVRGGNSSTCRLELDGVPLYNATHAFGIMSSLQAEMVGSSQIYTGGFKASYGNFTSGLIRATGHAAPVDRFRAALTVSPYIEGVYVEIPGRFSLRLGGRYSFMPTFAGLAIDKYGSKLDLDGIEVGGIVYDYNGHASYRFSDRSCLKASFFYAKDKLITNGPQFGAENGWETWMGKLEFETMIGEATKMETSVYATGSDSREGEFSVNKDGEKSSIFVDGHMYEVCGKILFSGKVRDNVDLSGGAEFKRILDSYSVSAFVDAHASFGKAVDLNLGLRQTAIRSGDDSRSNTDAHVLADVNLTDRVGLEFSFDRMNQYFHMLEGLPTGWALNLSVPINSRFPEETSNQLYAGAFSRFDVPALKYLGSMEVNFNVGAYFKQMSNLVSYVSSVNLLRNSAKTWEQDTDLGRGCSYGLETSVLLNADRLTANLAYTWSHTDRTFTHINDGKTFPFKFDRPHILNIQADYTLLGRTTRSGRKVTQHVIADLSYYSGNLMTVAFGQYGGEKISFGYEYDKMEHARMLFNNIFNRTQMTTLNGFRTPAYFRLDAGYAFCIKGRKVSHDISLSVYNVLNRHNPYMYFNEDGTWKQISILPILPSIRWKLSF